MYVKNRLVSRSAKTLPCDKCVVKKKNKKKMQKDQKINVKYVLIVIMEKIISISDFHGNGVEIFATRSAIGFGFLPLTINRCVITRRAAWLLASQL